MIPVCPKCDVELFILHFKDLEVDFCQRCRGLWLDAGELESLMVQTGAAPNDPLLESLNQTGAVPSGHQHLCPRCDQPLHEIQLQAPGKTALTLDRCPRSHGLWFDADELQQLLAMFPPATGASKTVAWLNDFFGKTLKT